MALLKGVGGVLMVLIGLVWIGQGSNVIGGSGMSGHPVFALLGIVVGGVGAWLAWSTWQARSGMQRK